MKRRIVPAVLTLGLALAAAGCTVPPLHPQAGAAAPSVSEDCPEVRYVPREQTEPRQLGDLMRPAIRMPRQPVARRHPDLAIEQLLRYAATASKWPDDQRQAELRRLTAKDADGRAGNDTQLRVALLLLLSHGTAVQQHRAQKILERLAQAGSPDEAAFATFLLGTQDPPRAAELDEVDKLKSQLEAERSQREVLQRKLDELKNIEKSMNERKPSETLPLEDVGKAKNSAGR